MRFIKKTNHEKISELSKSYKEFELFFSRKDCGDFETVLNEAQEAYKEQGAVITSVHCPESSYQTPLGEGCVNYMSWGEITGNKLDRDLFFKLCDFAEELAGIYGKEEPNSTAKVIVILHTGCQKGCGEGSIFVCPYKNTDMKKCCGEDPRQEEPIIKELLKYKNIVIAFENITPYDEKAENSGFLHENLALAERLNSRAAELSGDKGKLFGAVIDICHIFATHEILKDKTDPIEYLKYYMSEAVRGERSELICLLHLSKYNEDGTHGGIFEIKTNENDAKIPGVIREWCLKYGLSIPVTLELSGSEDTELGSKNFIDFVLNWSKLHAFLKENIPDERLYDFFEKLFEFYSMDITSENEKDAAAKADEIAEFAADITETGNPIFSCKTSDGKNVDIYLLQIRAYIIYMRFCNLAFDLINKYKEQNIDISAVLRHYMFNDKLGELRFDGLGTFYDIYWVKNRQTIFRCYDYFNGNDITKENSFPKIIDSCFAHIQGSGDHRYLSFGKAFGRVMMKYFDPDRIGGYLPDNGQEPREYNIMIIKDAPINCIWKKGGEEIKELTLQEFQDMPCDHDNFGIDFSEFYNDRGDKKDGDVKDASLFRLFKKITGNENKELFVEKVGSIYDKEVIFKNLNHLSDVHVYKLSRFEFAVMMFAYRFKLEPKADSDNDKKLIEDIIKYIPGNLKTIDPEWEDKPFFDVNDYIDADKISEILGFVDIAYEKNYEIYLDRKYSNSLDDLRPAYEKITDIDLIKKFNELRKAAAEND